MAAVDYTRQLDIVDPAALGMPITIIGAGGIGSPVAFILGKLGCANLTVIDFDVVEPHNLPNQILYGPRDVGQSKVAALKRALKRFGITVKTEEAKVEAERSFSGIVIFAVDSIGTRKMLFANVKFDAGVPLVIDARMGGTEAYVFAFDPRDPDAVRAYEDTLFSDEEAVEAPCTARAVIYVPFAVAAAIGQIVARYANGWRPGGNVSVVSLQFTGDCIVATDAMTS